MLEILKKLELLKKVKKPIGMCSIMIGPKGIAFAYRNLDDQGVWKIQACGFEPLTAEDNFSKNLAAIVNKYNLQGLSCNWVLHPSNYRLLLIDKPKVPQSEYRAAVRWQIKNMVDYKLDDIAIDIFFPPEDLYGYDKKLYVVVAQKSFLGKIVALLRGGQLSPQWIDIPELAIRNLFMTIQIADEKPSNFLHISETSTIFIVIKGDGVRFARHINVGLEQLLTDTAAVTKLSSEIKRSIDFYEAQLKIYSGEKILIGPVLQEGSNLITGLAENLGMPVEILNCTEKLNIGSEVTNETIGHCYVALGGVLREGGA